MSVFDGLKGKAEEFIQGNGQGIKDGIEKAGDFVDNKTGGKFAEQVDGLQEGASGLVDRLSQKDEPTQ